MTEKRKPFDNDVSDDTTLLLDEGSKIKMKASKKECKAGPFYSPINISTLHGFIQRYSSPIELRFQLILHCQLMNPYCSEVYLSKELPNSTYTREVLDDKIRNSTLNEMCVNENSSQSQKSSNSSAKKLCSSPKSGQSNIKSRLLSDIEIGQVILRTIEVLGINIERSSIMDILSQLTLTQELNEQINALLKYKSHYFEWMLRKLPNEDDNYNDFYPPLNFTQEQVSSYYNSIYDTSIQFIFEEFSKVSWREASTSLIYIVSIMNKIEQVVEGSKMGSREISEADSTKLLTSKEVKNLTDLQKRMQMNKEYFVEKLRIVTDRKYFNMNEVVSIPRDKLDEIQFIQLTHFSYFDEKLIFFILITICSIANSKGGHIFIGIHNTWGRGISLQEVTQHQIINEIRRICEQIFPQIFGIEHKIIHVIEPSKEKPRQKVVIRVDIPARKKDTIYFCSRYENQKAYFVKSNGIPIILNEDQQRKLIVMRSLEKDTPDIDDYLTLNCTREKSKCKPLHESARKSLAAVLKDYPVDPNRPNTWILNKKKHYLDSNEEKKNFTKEINVQLYKRSSENNQVCSIRNSHRSNSFISNSTNYPSSSKINNSHSRDQNLLSLNKFSRFSSNFNPISSRQNSENAERKKFQQGQNGRNNFKQNSDHKGVQEKQMSKVSQSTEITRRISEVNSNPSFKILEAWRRKRIVDYFSRNENHFTVTQFRQKSNFTKSILDQLDSLTPSTCYLVRNISEQKIAIFKDRVAKSFHFNGIEDFEFLGEIEQFIVIKVNRETICPALLDRIINSEAVNYSIRNVILHGFTYEYLELRECFNNSVSICILEFIFETLQIKYELKLSHGKLSLHFSTFIDFAFAYSALNILRGVFEETIDSKNVKVFFNVNRPNKS